MATITTAEANFEPLPQNGVEVVLAADFDRHGTRLVTGSADHRIRVFDLDERTGEWELVEAWRGHNAEVLDVKFHPLLSRPALLASTSSDLRLTVWTEVLQEAARSGRRFKRVYSQSNGSAVVYPSLDFACPPSFTSSTNPFSTVLAAVTRDGMVSLIEPVEHPPGTAPPGGPGPAGGPAANGAGGGAGDLAAPAGTAAAAANSTGAVAPAAMTPVAGGLREWVEREQIWALGGPVPRGTETTFKVAFQRGDAAGVGSGPSYAAVDAGLDARALTLAVAAMDDVKVYRLLGSGPDGDGPYTFGGSRHDALPVAELTGAQGLVRDVAWAPSAWRPRDRLATASADGFVRIYEIWTPEAEGAAAGSRLNLPAKSRAASTVGAAATPSGIGAGLAGASRTTTDRRFGPGNVLHRWEQVAELRHTGVWKVAWLREGSMIVSTADSGKALIWAQAFDGTWKEFADFGPENPGDPMIRPRH